jgi:hypothetical protein
LIISPERAVATRIEGYSFGSITIGSRTYTSDILIWPDRVRDGWWRQEGHSLCLDDLKAVLEVPPVWLLIGQGAPGLLKIPAGTRSALEERGIALHVMPTAEAVATWNRWLDEEGEALAAAAGFHLTC